ncbi:ATP-binding protein [Actinoplanes rectilineatus]|uniref:ATP-binding protein n=1 Tax=Actinoplanes rectilineatus TaxID=113571 RepID=UPI0005F2A24C|nr:ATP-binding protein [Actinoplanes rectilineatus]
MTGRHEPATAHLRIRLRAINRALRAAVARQEARSAQLSRPDLAAYCVTADHVDVLLTQVEATAEGLPGAAVPEGAPATRTERAAEQGLRRLVASTGVTLPFDELAGLHRIDRAEQDAILLVAAPDIDRSYERVYAYLADDLNRRRPSIDLLMTVLGGTPAAAVAVRRMLGAAGRLRRCGLVRVDGDTLGLAPGLLELLLGAGGEAALIGGDPGEVDPPIALTPALPTGELARLADAMNSGRIDLLGLWQGTYPAQRDTALALAAHAGRPLRRLVPGPDDHGGGPASPGSGDAMGAWTGDAGDPATRPDGSAAFTTAVATAAAMNALLWIPMDDLLRGTAAEHGIAALLCRSRVPAILSGTTAWRPATVLSRRAYTERELNPPGAEDRRRSWTTALPDGDPKLIDDLSGRYRLTSDELGAVVAVARAGARFAGNGRSAPLADHLRPAAQVIARATTSGYARALRPRRTSEDLVLPPEQSRTLLEIVGAFRAWPRIADDWGFRRRTGDAGMKVLFTGEPGTGKTLSAEVVAGMLGLDLLIVDLSRIVSKWVGETEKNLEAVFGQAEEGHAVLFFDEADSLFGKRGDVKHGTDRYANLEVGYLLQRLESSSAMVILASNLRENIDAAFTRRFQFVVSFPRPGLEERRRLWRLAFPPEAPLADDVDLDALARLDMTGAAIVSAARDAALITASSSSASSETAETITMRAVVAGVVHQYQREARLLRPGELGAYASLVTVAGDGRRR